MVRSEIQAVVLIILSYYDRAFSKSEERIQTLQLIWEARQSVPLTPHVPIVHNAPPPSDSPPNNIASHPTRVMPPYPPHTSGHQWTGSDQRQSTILSSSPGIVPTTQLSDDERMMSYHDPPISSGSSEFSTESPYTPGVPPMAASYSSPLHFDSKHEQMSHVHMSTPGPPAISLVNPPGGPGYSTTFPNQYHYQHVDQTVRSNLTHQPPDTEASFDAQGYTGTDTPIHDTGQTPLSREPKHSYSSAPYSYS